MAIQHGDSLLEATRRGLCAAAVGFFLACVMAGAAGVSAAETSHGAHEHGAAEIELAVEGSDALVNFASPLYNLVGFEHAPRDERDREAVALARDLLEDPGNLVRLGAEAACAVVDLDIDWDAAPGGGKEHDHEEEHDHDEDAEHDSHDPHDADEHEAHDAAEHDEHDADGEHADATVAIRYRCDHPDRLTFLVITAFESFARLSEVELRAVGPGGAVADSPERGSPTVDLRGLLER